MGYNLDNYAPVAERLAQASEQISMVVTEPPTMLTDAMGYIRATVGLKDGRSATGTATFRLDLTGRSAQATNPIEDCETSAVGRALAFLGYASSKSVASREEVQEAERRASYTAPPARAQSAAAASNGSAPKCDKCGAVGRLGKDGKSYYCPEKDKHGGRWYTIPDMLPSDLGKATEPAA